MTSQSLQSVSPTTGASPPQPAARKACVLDDEPAIGSFVCQLLAGNGFLACPFTEPQPFLAYVKANKPELIVLDLSLGGSDAVEVIRHLEIIHYNGKVLLMSGRGGEAMEEIHHIGHSHGLAMLPSLSKPFRAADLKSRLAMQPVRKDVRADANPLHAPHVELGEALRSRWLELWYQPKINLKTLEVCGAEGLLRARHPQLGIILPADILPLANDPQYHPLSTFVIGSAMSDWEHFFKQGLSLKLSVNVPVSVMQRPDFVQSVREYLPKNPEFPGIVIEVTEDEVIQDVQLIREIGAQLKLYNVELSIDDFGSAYSSLSRLRDMPCRELKLDRSFVTDCSSDQVKHSLCETVVALAHRLELSTCAEGIETAADLRSVIGLGFDTAQGFLFAKPMPAKELAGLLLKRSGAA